MSETWALLTYVTPNSAEVRHFSTRGLAERYYEAYRNGELWMWHEVVPVTDINEHFDEDGKRVS